MMRRPIVLRIALMTLLVVTLILFARTQMDFVYARF
jgi:hypothetical protein